MPDELQQAADTQVSDQQTGDDQQSQVTDQQQGDDQQQQGDDQQQAADQQAGKEGTGDESGQSSEPITYDTFKTPEDMNVDGDQMSAYGKAMGELGLSQEQAQGVLDYYIAEIKATAEGAVDGLADAFTQRMEGWDQELKDDKVLGGEKLDQTLATAKAGMEAIATPELVALLEPPSEQNPNGFGLNRHPEIVRMFELVGRAVAEDRLILGQEGQQGQTQADDLTSALGYT